MTGPGSFVILGTYLGSLGENAGTGDATDWRGKGTGVFADAALSAQYLAGIGFTGYLKGVKNGTFKFRPWHQRLASKHITTSAPIIQKALSEIIIMEQFNGFGRPDEGKGFKASFVPADHKLAGANPDDSWQGSGSDSYRTANKKQVKLAHAMGDADASLHAILKRQAGQIEDTRLVLASMKNFLTFVCIPIALALYTKPVVGPALSLEFQLAVVGVALSACAAAESTMVVRSLDNASAVREVISRYDDVSSAAKPVGRPFSLATGTGRASVSSGLGTFSGSAGADILTGGDSAADGSWAQPSLAQRQPSITRPPSLSAQTPTDNNGEDLLGAATLGLPKQQGPSSRAPGQVGQQISPASQIAARAPKGQRPGSAVEEGLNEIDANEAGAASGDDAVERAPVDVAAVHRDRASRASGRMD